MNIFQIGCIFLVAGVAQASAISTNYQTDNTGASNFVHIDSAGVYYTSTGASFLATPQCGSGSTCTFNFSNSGLLQAPPASASIMGYNSVNYALFLSFSIQGDTVTVPYDHVGGAGWSNVPVTMTGSYSVMDPVTHAVIISGSFAEAGTAHAGYFQTGIFVSTSVEYSTTPTPEPATWLMLVAGLGCLVGIRRV